MRPRSQRPLIRHTDGRAPFWPIDLEVLGVFLVEFCVEKIWHSSTIPTAFVLPLLLELPRFHSNNARQKQSRTFHTNLGRLIAEVRMLNPLQTSSS